MPYNPETDAYQPIDRPYKVALKKLAKRLHRSDRHTMEMLIDNACRAQGITIEFPEDKE